MLFAERTVCACKRCQSCCHEQPGHLLPGDMERIAAFLNQPVAEVKLKFWASPGAVLMDQRTQIQYRVGTITPRFDRRKKACVFLADDGACSIHPVAPFGCSYFDTHMPVSTAQELSLVGMKQIAGDAKYKELRNSLPFAESYSPKRY